MREGLRLEAEALTQQVTVAPVSCGPAGYPSASHWPTTPGSSTRERMPSLAKTFLR